MINYYAVYMLLSDGEIHLMGVGDYVNINECIADLGYEAVDNICVKRISEREYQILKSRIYERQFDFMMSN